MNNCSRKFAIFYSIFIFILFLQMVVLLSFAIASVNINQIVMAIRIHAFNRLSIKYQQYHAPTRPRQRINPVAHPCMDEAMDFYRERRAATQMVFMKMLTFNLHREHSLKRKTLFGCVRM